MQMYLKYYFFSPPGIIIITWFIPFYELKIFLQSTIKNVDLIDVI